MFARVIQGWAFAAGLVALVIGAHAAAQPAPSGALPRATEPAPFVEAAPVDASAPEGSVLDGGVADAGVPDGDALDGGVPESWTPGGNATDAGVPDAEAPDAGVADAELLDGGDAGLDAASDAAPADDETLDGTGGEGESDVDAGAAEVPVDAGAITPPPIEPFPPTPAPVPEVPKEERPEILIRTVLALLAVLALAYISGHWRFRKMQEALGLKSLITAGFPFVALGLVAKHPTIGALPDHGLAALGPLIEFSLGWLGLLVGLRFDFRAADQLPRRIGAVIGLETGLPFALATGTCAVAMALLGDSDLWINALRLGALLGIAAAMSTPPASDDPLSDSVHALAKHLDQVVGVLGLALVAAYFRPQRVELAWELPGTVWLFLTVGMGATLGVLAYALLRRKMSDAETMAIVLGVVAFAGGMAAYVALPPLVVCFVAGLMLANVPGFRRVELSRIMGLIERPIYLVFLFVAGAVWNPTDWRGWVLLLVFVASRFVGLFVAARTAGPPVPGDSKQLSPGRAALAPISVVSIAVVVGAQSLYQSRAVSWMMTAVLGGAMLFEILAQLARLRSRSAS